jgi:hypothetical protein
MAWEKFIMGRYVSWSHGNALTVESPENLQPGRQHFGWGTDVIIRSGAGSWFHIPLPVPAVVDDYPVYLKRVFLLFKTEANAFLQHAHIYDGSRRLQEFNDLHFDGDSTALLVPANTFALRSPHVVQRGISLSFFIQGTLGSLPNRLVVPAAGAEYSLSWPFLSTVAHLFDRAMGKVIGRGP